MKRRLFCYGLGVRFSSKKLLRPLIFLITFSAQAEKVSLEECERRTALAGNAPFLFYQHATEGLLTTIELKTLDLMFTRYQPAALQQLTEGDRGTTVQVVFLLESERSFREDVKINQPAFVLGDRESSGPEKSFILPIADRIFDETLRVFSAPDIAHDTWKRKRKLRLSLSGLRYTVNPDETHGRVPWHKDDCILQGIVILQKPANLQGGLNGLQLNPNRLFEPEPGAETLFFNLQPNHPFYFDGRFTLHNVEDFGLKPGATKTEVRDIISICVY